MLKVALNGARRPGDHPTLPLHPPALAADAAASVRAGAEAVHLHVRSPRGEESLEPADVAAALDAVREAARGVPVGVSTGAWIVPDPAERLRLVLGWCSLPDFASVNFHEPGAAELAEALLARSIGVEAGLASLGAARELIASGLGPRCLRVLLEPDAPHVEPALATADAIAHALDTARLQTPRLLHGTDATAWPLLAEASRRGYDARIGLEDTLELPDGRPAPGNPALVAAAVAVLQATHPRG